jgi:DNA-binding beta-propeller fold protein YncE
VHRLADGAYVATAQVHDPTFIAADPATATLYVSTGDTVSALCWNGSALVQEGVVGAVSNTGFSRPLAVIPPAPGQRTSYLVMGTLRTPTLLLLSLPNRRLVHTHTLEGMEVMGLVADPSGTAVAVCDSASNAVHVLPWPLPGMPPLQ